MAPASQFLNTEHSARSSHTNFNSSSSQMTEATHFPSSTVQMEFMTPQPNHSPVQGLDLRYAPISAYQSTSYAQQSVLQSPVHAVQARKPHMNGQQYSFAPSMPFQRQNCLPSNTSFQQQSRTHAQLARGPHLRNQQEPQSSTVGQMQIHQWQQQSPAYQTAYRAQYMQLMKRQQRIREMEENFPRHAENARLQLQQRQLDVQMGQNPASNGISTDQQQFYQQPQGHSVHKAPYMGDYRQAQLYQPPHPMRSVSQITPNLSQALSNNIQPAQAPQVARGTSQADRIENLQTMTHAVSVVLRIIPGSGSKVAPQNDPINTPQVIDLTDDVEIPRETIELNSEQVLQPTVAANMPSPPAASSRASSQSKSAAPAFKMTRANHDHWNNPDSWDTTDGKKQLPIQQWIDYEKSLGFLTLSSRLTFDSNVTGFINLSSLGETKVSKYFWELDGWSVSKLEAEKKMEQAEKLKCLQEAEETRKRAALQKQKDDARAEMKAKQIKATRERQRARKEMQKKTLKEKKLRMAEAATAAANAEADEAFARDIEAAFMAEEAAAATSQALEDEAFEREFEAAFVAEEVAAATTQALEDEAFECEFETAFMEDDDAQEQEGVTHDKSCIIQDGDVEMEAEVDITAISEKTQVTKESKPRTSAKSTTRKSRKKAINLETVQSARVKQTPAAKGKGKAESLRTNTLAEAVVDTANQEVFEPMLDDEVMVDDDGTAITNSEDSDHSQNSGTEVISPETAATTPEPETASSPWLDSLDAKVQNLQQEIAQAQQTGRGWEAVANLRTKLEEVEQQKANAQRYYRPDDYESEEE
jgi:hypothetical protein